MQERGGGTYGVDGRPLLKERKGNFEEGKRRRWWILGLGFFLL